MVTALIKQISEDIVETIHEPLLVLDSDLKVILANRSFIDTFKVTREETLGSFIYDLGNRQWEIPRLRELLEKILPEKTSFDNYEVEHDFATIGRRTMLLNARQIQRAKGKERIILLSIDDITERKEAEDELSRYRQGLERQIDEQTVELKEQVKEIGCLYAVLSLFTKPFKSIDEALKSTVYLIPRAWRYPEFCRARIVFEGREFAAEDFRETTWRQSADIVLSGETVGTVEVCYLEERPALDEGPFRKEERNLINELAMQLAGMVQRELAHARLEHLNSVLRSIRDVNKLIVHEKRRKPLLQKACKNLTHTRGLQGAWIILTGGLPDPVEGAQTGFNDIAFSELLNLFQRGETPACFRHGQTESGGIVTEDTVAACRNCPLADSYGGNSAITIELKHGNRRYGYMGIAVPIKFANDKEEASLFEEIAGDIAYALASIEQEETLRKSQHLLDARARIASAFLSGSDEDIFGDVLDIVLNLMQSEFGVFGYINEHGDLLIPSMTRHIWDKCRVPEKEIRFPRDTWGDSLWCRAIREKQTFHSNQPSVKVPVGHIPMHRNVAVPIVYQREVIGLLQVANKETDYDASDIHVLETISDVIAPILNTRLQRDREERLRIEAERAVKEAEKRYREIFEGTAEGILVADLEARRFKYCNPAICEMLGYSEEEIIGLDVTDIHPKESLDHVLAEFEAQARGDKILAPSLPCLRKDGSVIYADVQMTPAVIEGLECNVWFFTDVTKRRQIEAQLRQAQKMEAIGTLAGGVAHDFNNILTTIIGYADLMLMNIDTDKPLTEEIKEIKIAGERAAALTRQLLAFSRKQIVQPKVLDLNKLLTGIEKMLVRLIGEDIEILMIPESALWKIEIDPGQMEQVIMNLVVNAKDAMPIGGKLTIETANMDLDDSYFSEHGVVEERPGSYVMLAVSDTGIGMDKEVQEHIFDPFYTTKEKGKGTGLGLSTIYGIVKQNNGFIWVYSEPDKGSTFKIYLPKVKGDVKEEEIEQTPVENLSGSETVLIVEDDDSLRKLTRTILKQKGYKILEAENGEDALRVSKEHEGPIDLLITDVVMPKMSGKETAERLQPLHPQMKVIYMSGYTDDAIVHRGVLARGLNFLDKPFSSEGLVRKVREVLDK
jgi:PAS domain S-box-containing protein